MAVDLIKVQEHAPRLVNLTKNVRDIKDSLGIGDLVAEVIAVVDVSPSANSLFRSGAMRATYDLALAAALAFDDDGRVPTIVFDADFSYRGEWDLGYQLDIDFEADLGRQRGGTSYRKAIRAARGLVTSSHIPTYVLFITDGEPGDPSGTVEQELTAASAEPVFWQFIGVGPGVGTVDSPSFPFLERLDTMSGRVVDNAGFFAVGDPLTASVDQVQLAMLNEFPTWVREARAKKIIR